CPTRFPSIGCLALVAAAGIDPSIRTQSRRVMRRHPLLVVTRCVQAGVQAPVAIAETSAETAKPPIAVACGALGCVDTRQALGGGTHPLRQSIGRGWYPSQASCLRSHTTLTIPRRSPAPGLPGAALRGFWERDGTISWYWGVAGYRCRAGFRPRRRDQADPPSFRRPRRHRLPAPAPRRGVRHVR